MHPASLFICNGWRGHRPRRSINQIAMQHKLAHPIRTEVRTDEGRSQDNHDNSIINTARNILHSNPRYVSIFLTFKNLDIKPRDVSQFRLMPPTPTNSVIITVYTRHKNRRYFVLIPATLPTNILI